MKRPFVNTNLPSYQVHHAGAERAMREVAELIKKRMPPGFGFSLFIFEYEASKQVPGATFYVSTARREDMLVMLKEFIDRQEQGK